MKKIILVRHGEPDVNIKDKISGKEIPSFLEKYNTASLKENSFPSSKLIYLAQNATVVCSDLPRSISSAHKCEVQPKIIDSLFAESIPPHFQSSYLKMHPKQWLIFSRVLWLTGFSSHGESLVKTQQRAKQAAAVLDYEAEQQSVVLFGHGLFNIMIAKALKKRGYRGPKVPARNFWEYGIYRKS
jgi:broad specificity phosphatase PhoE